MTGPSRIDQEGPFRGQIGGRGDWIRTSDLLNPIQVRYQAALRPDRFVLRMSTISILTSGAMGRFPGCRRRGW